MDLHVNVSSERVWPTDASSVESSVRRWAGAENPDFVLIAGHLSQQDVDFLERGRKHIYGHPDSRFSRVPLLRAYCARFFSCPVHLLLCAKANEGAATSCISQALDIRPVAVCGQPPLLYWVDLDVFAGSAALDHG